jgi:hypothetical protein
VNTLKFDVGGSPHCRNDLCAKCFNMMFMRRLDEKLRAQGPDTRSMSNYRRIKSFSICQVMKSTP